MLIIVLEERVLPTEFETCGSPWEITFSENGHHLLSVSNEAVQVWQVKDRRLAATLDEDILGFMNCLAVSKDGKSIAAGTNLAGGVYVWDAKTYEQIFWRHDFQPHTAALSLGYIHALDFSPDSAQLVVGSNKCYVVVWDLTTHKRVQTLHLADSVYAVKYSPRGNRIATATPDSTQIWDSKTGQLLAEGDGGLISQCNAALVWSNNHLFVLSHDKIKELDASTGSTVSEWLVPDSNKSSCIALPKHGEFIAYATNRTITFWDTSTHSQLALIQHHRDIRSIAFSSDDRLLAIGRGAGISIKRLFYSIVSIMCR